MVPGTIQPVGKRPEPRPGDPGRRAEDHGGNRRRFGQRCDDPGVAMTTACTAMRRKARAMSRVATGRAATRAERRIDPKGPWN
jgi:hypothetical protein